MDLKVGDRAWHIAAGAYGTVTAVHPTMPWVLVDWEGSQPDPCDYWFATISFVKAPPPSTRETEPELPDETPGI